MNATPTVYPPAEVCRQLGVSSSGLRRLARIYETVLGELPRDAAGGRLYPEEAVQLLRAARTRVEAGRAKSVSEALASPELETEEALHLPPEVDQGAVMVEVLRELRLLRSEVAELRQEGQQRALEQPVEQPAMRSERRGGLLARLRRRVVELLRD